MDFSPPFRPVGGWRSGPAGLEVGGKGKIIANFGFRIANLETRRQESGDEIKFMVLRF